MVSLLIMASPEILKLILSKQMISIYKWDKREGLGKFQLLPKNCEIRSTHTCKCMQYIKEETKITVEYKHSRVDLNRLLLKDKVVGRGRPGSGQPAASLSPYTNTKSWPTVKHKRAMTNTRVMTNTGLVVNGDKHSGLKYIFGGTSDYIIFCTSLLFSPTTYLPTFETRVLKFPSFKDVKKVKVKSRHPYLQKMYKISEYLLSADRTQVSK